MKNLITGIHGFAASHLANLLLDRGEEVCGLARPKKQGVQHKSLPEKIRVYYADVCDSSGLKQIIGELRPQRIYHLAAMSFVPLASQSWSPAFETNLFGTLNLLDQVKRLGIETRILWVGSSEEYGEFSGEGGSIKEDRPLKPVSLYGLSKMAADLLARYYFEKEELNILTVRPFNHIGPGQDSRFFCSSIARQIAEIEMGAEPVIRTGNLDSFRDFTDVRDTVCAYLAVMENGRAGDIFNICTGQCVRMRQVLSLFLQMTQVVIRIETDPSRYRNEKANTFQGDASFLQQRTGWRPEISLTQSLSDILNFWREKIREKNKLGQ